METQKLSSADVWSALSELDRRAAAEGMRVEISIYGGGAMLLCFDALRVTHDVDAVAKGDPVWLRKATASIAAEYGWANDWLNDAVKGFLSDREKLVEVRPQTGSWSALKVMAPSVEYLFAMKCMAMRTDASDADSSDRSDIQHLLEKMDVTSVDDALEIVEQFYPKRMIPAKTQFGVEEVVGDWLEHRLKTPLEID